MLGDHDSTYVNGVLFAVIGPITNETLQKFGYREAIVPKKYTIRSLVEALSTYYRDKEKNYASKKAAQA
jgi:uroporphyrinogen-III synthase